MKVCSDCFKDIEVKSYISSSSTLKGKCDFCDNEKEVSLINIEELLDFFSAFISIFKKDESGHPLNDLVERDWNLFSNESKANSILSEILVSIKSLFIDPTEKVVYIDEIEDCVSFWSKLKEDLKWERRFLTDLELIEDLRWDSYFSNSQIEINSNETYFRARIHQMGQFEPFPIDDMGCPKKNFASSGRANPQGIPYLYLSKSKDTTLYETRASYLDDVSIGKFIINDSKNLRLVDFTTKASAFSFDTFGSIIEFTKSVLLKRNISLDLSRPLRRYDSELEYIPTQFICEYIRYITDADGILFDSSLHFGGKNIVLFNPGNAQCVSVEKHRVSKIIIESTAI
jgi:hypothetical protein